MMISREVEASSLVISWKKSESGDGLALSWNFNISRMPDQIRHDESGPFCESVSH